ncbi:MAG: hypothetical protein E6R03_13810 [Hyphomicrobiaceae bacterium]|nr:MAG: hypothetical protein E6R03_13810 [Hyphomicrobiaceae bacterium]
MADAKRKPGRPATGRRPELREVSDPETVSYCKAQQLLSPGFLAGLVEQHRLENQRGAKTPNVL